MSQSEIYRCGQCHGEATENDLKFIAERSEFDELSCPWCGSEVKATGRIGDDEPVLDKSGSVVAA